MGNIDIRFLAGHHVNAFNARGDVCSLHQAIRSDDFWESNGHSIFRIHATLVDSVKSHHSLFGFTHSDTDRKTLINSFCLSADKTKLCSKRLLRLFESLIFGDKTTLLQEKPSEKHVIERAKRLVLGFHEDLRQLFGPHPVLTDLLELFQLYFSGIDCSSSLEGEIRFCTPDHLRSNQREYLMRVEETTDSQAVVMFSTGDGRLGIGSCSLQQDDIVVIARGCQVPLALQRSGEYNKLVAPVYVSGIMQGEFVRYHEGNGTLNVEQMRLI